MAVSAWYTPCTLSNDEIQEHAFAALPAHRVPLRLTTAEQLAQAELLNQRDRRPALAPLASYAVTEEGTQRHRQFGVVFRFADGTERRFAPHTN